MRMIVELSDRFARTYDEVAEIEDRLPEVVGILLRMLKPLRDKLRSDLDLDDYTDLHIY